MNPVRDVCVIGLGLIGGSLLRAAAASGRTAFGAAVSEGDADAASRAGYDVTTDVEAALHRAAAEDAMVVLAGTGRRPPSRAVHAVRRRAPDGRDVELRLAGR
jgi:prephenate dehydrogenase